MRLLAIGDIHGCLGPLDNLLQWVAPTSEDTLVALGDYVDRGPDSRGVLDRLIELRSRLHLVCLRGNHEQLMVEAYRGGRGAKKMWLSVGGVQTLGSYGSLPGRSGTLDDIPATHWEFLDHGLVDYYETDQFIFTHAIVLCDRPLSEQPDFALRWEFLSNQLRHQSGKTVICGHTSQKSGVPKVVPGAVCIDTYAHGGGWLTCLDVPSGHYWQTDLLGRRRDGHVDYLS
jgi:serine/threonine protein phosphatase 1